MRRPLSNRRQLSVETLENRLLLYNGFNPTATLVTNIGDIEFELLEDNAPNTVDNFLNYVSDGDYVNSMFHRLAPDFVLQGGSVTHDAEFFCPVDACTIQGLDTSLYSSVPTDDPIANEFEVSNTRGTVAMAKRGGDPNSATSQFFVNLSDDNTFLDNNNGGFTVFARVVDMTVVDSISDLSAISHGGALPGIFTDPSQAAIRGAFSTGGSTVPYKIVDGGYHWIQIEEITGTSLAHGTVFFDADADGVRDANESGRGGVTVFDDANQNGVLDNSELATTTDSNGDYHLTFDGDHTYNLVMTDGSGWSQTGASSHSGSLELGHSQIELDFATRFTAAAWHNTAAGTDVNGVNGIAPIDAIQVINELNLRNVSDPTTGLLSAASVPTNRLFFPDVNNDGSVTPTDAIQVINVLNSASPVAALSASVSYLDESGDEDERNPLDSSLIDDVFAGGDLF